MYLVNIANEHFNVVINVKDDVIDEVSEYNDEVIVLWEYYYYITTRIYLNNIIIIFYTIALYNEGWSTYYIFKYKCS